jgi:hypothetical protein
MKFTVYENSQSTQDLINSIKTDIGDRNWNIEDLYRFLIKFYKTGACKHYEFQLINNILSVYLYGKLLFEVTG